MDIATEDDEGAYRFDAFVLEPSRGTLRTRGGADIVLRPKALALLQHLLERPGVLLTRLELLDSLWPGVVVTDDSLTQCISDLRHALGARSAQVLRTVPRRGYVFTAEVERKTVAEPRAARDEPSLAPGRDVLVVEAFEADCNDPGAAHLAHALEAEVLAALNHSEPLHVLVRAAAPPPGAFRLRGTLLQAGPSPVLSVMLDEGDSGLVLWTEQVALPPPAGRAFAVARILARVGLCVSAETLRRARGKAPDERTPRDLLLLGRERHRQGGEANTLAAQMLFRQVIAGAPDLAVAHGYHALTVLRCITHGWGERDWAAERRVALEIARHGVALEPRSALCLAALAFALLHAELWDEAIETARLSLGLASLDAIDTRTVCAEVLAAAGEGEQAAVALGAALELDPFGPPRSRAVLGRALLMAGRTEEAMAELHRAAALLPDYAPCLRSIVVAAVELGRMDEAGRTLARLQRLQPSWFPTNRSALSFFRHRRDLDRFLAAFAACETWTRAEGHENCSAGTESLAGATAGR